MSYISNKFLEILVSSHNTTSEFFNISIALKVMSFRLPIGVETIYNPLFMLFFFFSFFKIINFN